LATSVLAGASALTSVTLYGVRHRRSHGIETACARRGSHGCTASEINAMNQDQHVPRVQRGINSTLTIAAVSAVTATVLWVIDRRLHRRSGHALARGVIRF
jgi:hypothetical protein